MHQLRNSVSAFNFGRRKPNMRTVRSSLMAAHPMAEDS